MPELTAIQKQLNKKWIDKIEKKKEEEEEEEEDNFFTEKKKREEKQGKEHKDK